MTRRKSVCLKWTLVLFVVIFCPYVHTRPQDDSASSVKTELTTENLIRYRNNYYNLRYSNPILPIVTSSVDITLKNEFIPNKSRRFYNIVHTKSNLPKSSSSVSNLNRTSRLIKSVAVKDMSKSNNFKRKAEQKHKTSNEINKIKIPHLNNNKQKPAIKKVITKWKDETKLEDLNFTYEITSDETDSTNIANFDQSNYNSSTENTKDEPIAKKRHPHPSNYFTAVYKPQNEYSDESHVYSTNVQVVDRHPLQSTYMYTKRPTPTPEITNVGYPTPWYIQTPPTHHKRPTTQKPVQVTWPSNYNYHNNFPNYGNEYEVSTFAPSSAYTDRIVIRPEEYSGSNPDCPTIYLTLNNTFQGQAKEACPDLNIAVNTNVINKNQVIESDEEDGPDSLFPNSFGLQIGEDSDSGDANDNDYFGSTENAETESASLEGTELSHYNAANTIQSESSESGSLISPSSPSAALHFPGRPDKDDDDIFSYSSLVQFFRPAINALGWLASVNPFTVGLFPLFLAPIAFLFAGSGLAALFTPWFLPIGREAPKVIHVYRPYWHWDDTIKTWHLHSFPNNRGWKPFSRSSKEDVDENENTNKTPILAQKIKDWMINITKVIKQKVQNFNARSKDIRKNKRKKRETWSIRVR